MTNETLQKKLDSILTEHTTKEVAFAEVLNLINILKSDISLAIKNSGQTGGVVDFIAVPTAVDIVTKGGIPTKAERIRLAMEYMNDGNSEQANELLEQVLKDGVD